MKTWKWRMYRNIDGCRSGSFSIDNIGLLQYRVYPKEYGFGNGTTPFYTLTLQGKLPIRGDSSSKWITVQGFNRTEVFDKLRKLYINNEWNEIE